MDELEDLDAFISNIEQSAPAEEDPSTDPRCESCDTILEEIDGDFVCPNCNVHATNIQQLEGTELIFYDENGRRIPHGQAIRESRIRSNRTNDYGWAWSTDEAIVFTLNHQLKGLLRYGLVNDLFCQGVKNMWTKFWLENIAPVIKDSYDENDLIPLSLAKTMKFRDIEVLVKVQDKVVVANKRKANKKGPPYKMMSAKFYKMDSHQREIQPEESADLQPEQPAEGQPEEQAEMICNDPETIETMNEENDLEEGQDANSATFRYGQPLLNVSHTRDKFSILTLDRTLAFIEGTARCIDLPDPIFASDIIRACNCRIIPFFGAHRTLPERMKFNYSDTLMFQRVRPPTPIGLTRAASALLFKVYHDRFPAQVRPPNLDRILERFVYDMNLPYEILNIIKDRVSFEDFSRTKTKYISGATNRRAITFPQYDRWAFAILICQIKRLFNLSETVLKELDEKSKAETRDAGEKYFSFIGWQKQMSIRLKLIFRYDPYVLFHPMTELTKLKVTPQMTKYIEEFYCDKPSIHVRNTATRNHTDVDFLDDLSEFLHSELPRPSGVPKYDNDGASIDRPVDMKHPIRDAIDRTKRFWWSEMSSNREIRKYIFKDYYSSKLLIPVNIDKWSLYDGQPDPSLDYYSMEILPKWPYCFKLLLSVGGFICYCEPRELLMEIRWVEEYLYPSLKFDRKRIRAEIRDSHRRSTDMMDTSP